MKSRKREMNGVMTVKKSIKLNYFYNVSYQILSLITPLLTTPYLSRVLGAEGIGISSYTESVVAYFILFAVLGSTTYGQREISYVQNDKEKRSIVFWNIFFFRLITTFLAIIIYISFALLQEQKILYFILTFNLLGVVVDISWFYQGIEEFGLIVLRNIFFKIINIAYIFIFVRTSDDVGVYLFGVSFLMFIGNVSLWLKLSRYICFVSKEQIKPMKHLKVILSFFAPAIAVQVYTVLDKTMIGVITKSAYENGCYEQALKLSRMVLTIVTSLGTVMVPRIGYHFERKEFEVVRSYIYSSYQFVWFMAIPLTLGLVGVSTNIVPWFYGEGFDKVIPLLQISSFLIILIGISNVTGTQYLVPTKRQNILTITVIIGAVVNFSLNMILIPILGSIGAAIASIVAESVITISQVIFVRKEISPLRILSLAKNYLIAGCVMFSAVWIETKMLTSSIINTCFMVLSGGIIYFAFLLILKDSFFLLQLNSIKKKVLKK